MYYVESLFVVTVHNITVLFVAEFIPNGIVLASVHRVGYTALFEGSDDHFIWNFVPHRGDPVCQLGERSTLDAPGRSELMFLRRKPVGIVLAKPVFKG